MKFTIWLLKQEIFSFHPLSIISFLSFIFAVFVNLQESKQFMSNYLTQYIVFFYLLAVVVASLSSNPFSVGRLSFWTIFVRHNYYFILMFIIEFMRNILLGIIFSIFLYLMNTNNFFQNFREAIIVIFVLPMVSVNTLLIRSVSETKHGQTVIFALWVFIPVIALIFSALKKNSALIEPVLGALDVVWTIILYSMAPIFVSSEGMGYMDKGK